MAEGNGPISLAAGLKNFILRDGNGKVFETFSARDVFSKTLNSPVLICNKTLLKSRLGSQTPRITLDVLELFAFVCPAVFFRCFLRILYRFSTVRADLILRSQLRSAIFAILHVILPSLYFLSNGSLPFMAPSRYLMLRTQ